MTIQLNLTPSEATKLHWILQSWTDDTSASILTKLHRQAHKFATAVSVTELKLPATGNVNLATPLADRLEEVRTKAIDGGDPWTKKIAIIKAIRELCGGAALGLADAKGASENWSAFIAFVRAHDRLPEPGFYYGTMK